MPHHRSNNISSKALSEKNMLIGISIAETREKRQSQECKVITVKITNNKLNNKQKESLKMLFLEAKWIRNEMINFGQENNIFDYVPKDFIQIKNKNKEFEIREKKYISAQQVQAVITEVKDNIKSLAKTKERGKRKIGSLKFTSEIKSINLKQYNATYKIKSETKIKVQGVPGDVKVKGLDQLKKYKNCDFANAKLLNKPDGYYIAITVYINKNELIDSFIPNTEVGIDMGLKDNVTLSNGKKINVYVEETERLKKLQKKLSKQEKGSNNRYKTKKLIRKEYQKMSNVKEDIANKIVSELKNYETIYFQDENLVGWKNKKSLAKGSKKIQHSILGRVKSRLKNCNRAIMIDRYCATTQTCICGCKNKMTLDDRTYSCNECGYSCDRDTHSANMMILFGKKSIGLEQTKSTEYGNPCSLTPVEILTAVAPLCCAVSRGRLKQEASESLVQR